MYGCAGQASQNDTASADTGTSKTQAAIQPFLVFTDQLGRKVVLDEKPLRIVLLNTELLQLFEQVGGTPIGRATAPGVPVPDKAKAAEEVGLISNVNMEKIVQLQPDLVIGQPVFHAKLEASFEQAGVPFAVLTIKSIDDMRNNALLLGKIAGTEEAAAAAVSEMNEKIRQITDSVPDTKPTYAILTFMMNTVTVQKGSSIAVDVADRLKMRNVAASLQSGPISDSVPFSMEKLVELNPEYLFFVVHGTDEEGQQTLKANLQSNPAWLTLKAVKENNFQFLPSSLFVNNPGLALDRSFEYLAKIAYPAVFGSLR